MSNAAIHYLRLLRRIVRDVRESAWRLGGAEETFLAEGFDGDGGPVAHPGGYGASNGPRARIQEPVPTQESSCGQSKERA